MTVSWSLPAKGEHVYANKRASEITGFSVQEILEAKMQDLAHPDELQNLKKRLRERLNGKTIPPRYETAVLRKDGKKVPVEITGAKTSWHGQPADIVIIRDITERKHREEELEALVEERTAELTKTTGQLKALINATTDTALLIDLEGRVIAANEITARRFGMSLEQLLGKCIYDLMPPSLARSRKARVNRVIKTGKPQRFEEKQGEIIFDIMFFPVFGEEGKVVQLAIYGKDITDRLKALESLKQKESELRLKNIELTEANTALKVFLRQSKEDKGGLTDTILTNVKELVEPYLKKLKKSKLDASQEIYLDIIESNITDILSPFLRQMTSKYSVFTPRKIQVAILVKEGRSTKEIAKLLNVSSKAMEFYRQGLRRKLGLKSRKVNLRSHFISLRQP